MKIFQMLFAHKTYIQGWSDISTMPYLNKEQEQLKKDYQKEVQKEANRTGKKEVLHCLAGWDFTAEPKVKGKKGNDKNSKNQN